MTPLRKRTIEEIELRNDAAKTVAMMMGNVARFARHFGKSPELLGEEHFHCGGLDRYLLITEGP